MGYLTSDGSTLPVSLVVLSEPAFTAILARDLSERYEVERMKDGFVSNVSHELRTPLTAVIGYLELLREGSLGELTPTQAEVVEVMGRNGERLLELIGQILHVGALDADHPVVHDRLDVSALVADVVAEHEEHARDTAVALVTAIHPAVTVMGDPGELRSAVSNLVANAVKFTPAAGVVDVRVTPRGRTIAIVISDTGIGIPEADLDQVFRRFYRGEYARALQIQGTGLGLAIVEGAVRRHGGTVTVSSAVGIGTTFEMLLPAPPDGDGAHDT